MKRCSWCVQDIEEILRLQGSTLCADCILKATRMEHICNKRRKVHFTRFSIEGEKK